MEPPNIAFPCDYPVKIVARAVDGLRGQLDEIVTRHAGGVDPSQVTERASAQQNFVSVTYLIKATGETQLAALFADLKTLSAVMLVL